jgi:hypothetical protein
MKEKMVLPIRKIEDTKGVIENRWRADNTMAKQKKITIYKTQHRKLKIEQHETH